MRPFDTGFGSEFLKQYQHGVLRYTYKGIPCQKSPIDIAIYMQLLWNLRPALILEVGSKAGGSALLFSDIANTFGLNARVISIDLEPPALQADTRITFLRGDVNDLGPVLKAAGVENMAHPWFIVEDSAHTFEGCYAALKTFSDLMNPGDVLAMEDGILEELGLSEKYNGGPNRAIRQFLMDHPGLFSVLDRYCDMFGFNATYNLNGYLVRNECEQLQTSAKFMIKLSILLVIYDMPREAPRTVISMLPPYQKDAKLDDFEILILDNGSTRRLPSEFVSTLAPNVRIIDVPDPDGSPGRALNWGATQARFDNLMFCIDGARMFSDRLVATSLEVLERFPDAFVYTLGWHLGPDVQMRSVANGYNHVVEDELLERANWLDRPDDLFAISALAGSSAEGITGSISESNAFAVSRRLFDSVGGYDERFRIPGGSTSNLEIFTRYVTRPGALNICLAAEGTFHQVHGGVATSHPEKARSYFAEYEKLTGSPHRRPDYRTLFYGRPRKSAMAALRAAAEK